jgi:predicted nuclease of predicted toxin-antitoxin system
VKIRLYFDEDSMRHALVEALRKRGVDVLTTLEAGTIEQTDQEQLGFAAAEGRVLYSYNVGDFCKIHSDWLRDHRPHFGIVLCRQSQFSIGEQMKRLLKLIGQMPAEDMRDRLEFLGDWC